MKQNENGWFKIECVCIKDVGLIKGNIYTCEGHIESIYYSVSTANKYYGLFETNNFITLAEWRDKQIDKILKDE